MVPMPIVTHVSPVSALKLVTELRIGVVDRLLGGGRQGLDWRQRRWMLKGKMFASLGPLAVIDDGYTIHPIDISLFLLIIKLKISKRKEIRHDEQNQMGIRNAGCPQKSKVREQAGTARFL
jgi:hypothetical protein